MFEAFTYADYEQLLALLTPGRANRCFGEWLDGEPSGPFFLLRHDVDFAPEAALAMARLEAEAGVRATYFLLLGGDRYNLLAEECCTLPRELADLGHEVGLHYDVRALARRPGDDPARHLQCEADLLAALSGKPVRAISMHCPSVYGDDPCAGVDRFVSAYDPRFTQEIASFSDSCGAWRDQTHEVLASGQLPDRLQMLVHPIFWAETPGNRWLRLEAWAQTRRRQVDALCDTIRERWKAHAGVREHERRLD